MIKYNYYKKKKRNFTKKQKKKMFYRNNNDHTIDVFIIETINRYSFYFNITNCRNNK